MPTALLSLLALTLLSACSQCEEVVTCDGDILRECRSGETWYLSRVFKETDCSTFTDGTCHLLGDDRGGVCVSQPLEPCDNGTPPWCSGDALRTCMGGGSTGPDRGYIQETDCAAQEDGATCIEGDGAGRCQQPGLDHEALSPPAEVHASFVLLGTGPFGDAVAYARVIQDDGFACPALSTDCSSGMSTPMTARAKPGFSTVAHCPDGDCFPVTVCEAEVPFDSARQVCLSGSSITLPTPKKAPSDILIMGDTGCKSDSDSPGGNCSESGGTTAEPFASLISSVSGSPDLILHMGDYNYRGTPGSAPWLNKEGQNTTHHPYDAGDGGSTCGQSSTDPYRTQASSRSLLPDQWDIWKKDFFDPAAPMLATAPWVFARGNHELCSRAGPGFLYFLDAGFADAAGQLDCPGLDGVDHPDNPFPYTITAPVRTIPLSGINIILLDSANACDDGVPGDEGGQENPFVALYSSQLSKMSVPGGETIIMSHRPFWANKTLQATSSNGADLKGISLSLAGHQHRFASYTPTTPTDFPGEIVAGNGGVALSGDADNGCTQTTIAGAEIWEAGAAGHGLLSMQLNDTTGAWTATLKDARGSTTATCASGAASLCTASAAACPP